MPRPVIASDHLNPLVIQTAPSAPSPATALAPAAVAPATATAPADVVTAVAVDDVVFDFVGWMLLMTERKTKRLL